MTTNKEMETIILPESPEAAQFTTVTGWVSRNGQFWGNDDDSERMARMVGATHVHCAGDGCEKILPVNHRRYCPPCLIAHQMSVWQSAPRLVWDTKTPLYSERLDCYMWAEDDGLRDATIDAMGTMGRTHAEVATALMLYICEPQYACLLDSSHFENELPQDGDLPGELAAAIDLFNATVKSYTQPLSWVSTGNPADVSAWIHEEFGDTEGDEVPS